MNNRSEIIFQIKRQRKRMKPASFFIIIIIVIIIIVIMRDVTKDSILDESIYFHLKPSFYLFDYVHSMCYTHTHTRILYWSVTSIHQPNGMLLSLDCTLLLLTTNKALDQAASPFWAFVLGCKSPEMASKHFHNFALFHIENARNTVRHTEKVATQKEIQP